MTKPLSFVFILGFFSFLVMPFSYTGRAMDPTLHSGFVIWSFLTLGLSIYLLTKQKMQPSLVELMYRKIFWVGGIFLLMATFSLIGSINMGEGVFARSGIILTGSFFFICILLQLWF